MNLNEARDISAWNRDPKKAVWHPDTEDTMDALIAEIERLQKANDDLIAQGPRLFDMGTVLSADPVLLKMAHESYVSEAEKDGAGSQRTPMNFPRDKTDDWEERIDTERQPS